MVSESKAVGLIGRAEKPDGPPVTTATEAMAHSGAITATGLTVRYGPVFALDRFTTKMPRGIVGLLGPNGAGKSTFIKALLGLVPTSEGMLSIGGLDPKMNPLAVRDIIGYMPEHDCLIGEMNSVELLSYMGQISGMLKRDVMARSHEVMDFVGIGEERYRKISSYSTGMKQKVKLAQAIVHDPQTLLLDEPTNGMDPYGREEMLGLIKKIGGSNKTILVSSHVLSEVEQVGDHAVIIGQGRTVREGRIHDLMMGEKGLYELVVRGGKDGMNRFIETTRLLPSDKSTSPSSPWSRTSQANPPRRDRN